VAVLEMGVGEHGLLVVLYGPQGLDGVHELVFLPVLKENDGVTIS